MRVALYTRVSTEDQAKEGFSMEAQERRLRSYADAQHWTVIGVYADEGQTGRTTKRPAYQRMLEERASWDVVLVLKMDRIHRNVRNFMDMMEFLKREGKDFASVTENLDTGSAIGRFVMGIIQGIAQLESEQTGERTLFAMKEKAMTNGGSLGAPTPFGFTRRKEDGMLLPNENEATLVRFIFMMAHHGHDYQDIARHMQESYAAMGRWDRMKVRRILLNRAYAGCTYWNEILQLDTHEAIISKREFNDVHERLGTGVRID